MKPLAVFLVILVIECHISFDRHGLRRVLQINGIVICSITGNLVGVSELSVNAIDPVIVLHINRVPGILQLSVLLIYFKCALIIVFLILLIIISLVIRLVQHQGLSGILIIHQEPDRDRIRAQSVPVLLVIPVAQTDLDGGLLRSIRVFNRKCPFVLRIVCFRLELTGNFEVCCLGLAV